MARSGSRPWARARSRGPNGVNGQLSALLGFPGGAQATLTTTMRAYTPGPLTVMGTEAAVTLDGPFNSAGGLTVRTADGETHRWDGQPGSHVGGLHYQAAAAARAIAGGRLEVDERPLALSPVALRVADELRRQVGIVFPGE